MFSEKIQIKTTDRQQGILLGSPRSTATNIEVCIKKGPKEKWMPWELYVTIMESANHFIGEVQRVRYIRNGLLMESWAKTWQTWDDDSGVWRVQRLGAGAYGDHIVWQRPILKYFAN